MKFTKFKWSKALAMVLAVVMVIMSLPMSAFAAPASDLPANMVDHAILRALEYTGYDVQKQKNDGTLYQSGSYGSRTPESVLSNINYGTGLSGFETIDDSSTPTGKAPDIARFERNGLCCASFVTYFVCNYMPNIEGADTQAITDAIKATGMNSQAVVTWQTALKNIDGKGMVEKIGTSSSNVDRSKLTPGDLIIFGNEENSHTHIAVYSGTYKGTDFLIHVGNDRGPEIMPVHWMSDSSNGAKASYPNAYYHINPKVFEDDGDIEVYKKDTDGNKLAGAEFLATNTETGKSYKIGPTNSNGYAKTANPIPYGTYTVKETKFPTNFHAYGKTEWTVTVDANNNGLVTVNAVNEIDNGNAKIVKTSEDGEVAGVTFRLTGNGVDKTVTTNANGEITIKELKPGTYKVTETVADKYEPQETRNVTVVSNQTATVTFNNVLKRGDLSVTKTSEDGLVEGVQFRLFGTSLSGHEVNQYATTNANGIATFKDVLISNHQSYTIEEINTAERYIVPANQKTAIEWNKVINKSFYNELKHGDLKVTKTSEDNLVEGLKFHLYGTSFSGIPVDEYAVTDENGIAYFDDILMGTGYTLEEVNTPIKYVIPDSQTANVEWNKVTEKSVENILKKWRADVFKVDAELAGTSENGLVPIAELVALDSDTTVAELGSPYGESQGDATLAGAVYGVYKDGQLIDTYTTDKNGHFVTDYYVCGDGWYIREITPSNGYLLDPTIYEMGAYPEEFTVELNTLYPDVIEQIIRGNIAIIKHCDDGSTKIETPESGAKFEIFLKSAGSYKNSKDTERDVLICDEYGFAESISLPYGVYTVKQVKGWEGKELMPPFDVNICEDGRTYRYLINNATFEAEIEIVKKDIETSKIIPDAGVGFKVKNTDTGEYVIQKINYPTPTNIEIYYTDATGKLMMPYALPYGNYEIIEQTTAYGYVLDSEPVAFKVDGSTDIVTVVKSNISQKGIISVNKTGEVFSSVTEKDGVYQPVYSIKGLEGAVYEIKALEDVVTLDGTKRYEKGQVVATITTDKNGKATTEPLYLGKYEVKEITAPFGMIINTTPVNVELEYAGEKVEITSTSASFVNERQKAELALKKVLEQDEDFGIGLGDEILNVKFGLFATETMTAADGKTIPKDALIEVAVCNKEGKINFTTDLPVNAKVYAKEIATDNHYILSNRVYNLTFNYEGQDTEIVKLTFNEGNDINNEIIRGYILGHKLDEDGFAIAGALFGLFHENETEFTEETAIRTSYSNPLGYFAFMDVPFGRWLVREIKPAPAFALNENSYAVTVSEAEETVEIEIENKFIVGSVTTTKVDEEYPENKLTGAIFEIYVDVDRDKEYNPEIDKFVGEMTESEKGVYTMNDLRYNGYFLHEKVAPEGFLKDDGYYYFEIRENGQQVAVENKAGVGFTNKPITGEIEITKTDIADGKPIAIVGFRIKDANGKTVVEGYTDENGIAKFTLRYGKYTYSEFKAANGYIANTEEHTFEITENGQIIKASVTNEKIPVPDIPQTGDNSMLGFWIGLAAIALGGLISFVIVGIKRKKEDDED